MSKKIYLHIGNHKTGSTAIQMFLNSNREKLNKLGFYYPDIFMSDSYPYNHHNISWELSGDSRFNTKFKTLDDFYDLIKKTEKNIIISSEDFQVIDYNKQKFKKFQNEIKKSNYSIIIILYLRNQIDFFNGVYQAMLMFGVTLTKASEVWKVLNANDFFKVNQINFWFNYYQQIIQVKKMFEIEKQNIICLSYDQNKDNLIPSFLKILKLQDIGFDYKKFKNINPSRSDLSIKMIEFFNLLNNSYKINPDEKKMVLEELVNNKAFSIGKKFYIKDQSYKEFMTKKFFDSNQLVEKEFNIILNKFFNSENDI